MILAIDPGVHFCGLAISDPKTKTIVDAVYLPLDQVWRYMCEQYMFTKVVIECPRIYPQARQKGDQNDLINLARVVGQLERWAECPVQIVYPRDWKGTVDPDVMIDRIKKRLTNIEGLQVRLPKAKSKHHNVWDAVGINLWATGRLKPNKVYDFAGREQTWKLLTDM